MRGKIALAMRSESAKQLRYQARFRLDKLPTSDYLPLRARSVFRKQREERCSPQTTETLSLPPPLDFRIGWVMGLLGLEPRTKGFRFVRLSALAGLCLRRNARAS